ncbi:hypothetical protein D3C71_1236170 [compost metagenome]
MLVQQQDVALVARSGGAVEQHQMTDLRCNLFKVVPLGGGDQALQGQVIELDRTQDIGIDQLRDGGRAACGGLLGVGVFADQQESDDAQDRDDGQGTAEDHHDLGSPGRALKMCGAACGHRADVR